MWCVVSTWVIVQGAVADQTFQAPPYDIPTGVIGNLVVITRMIGFVLSTLIGSWVYDAVFQAMTIRNKCVFEPKFRLFIVLIFLVVTIVDFFGLGIAIQNELSNIVCTVFLSLLITQWLLVARA